MEELPPFEYMFSYLNVYLASYGLCEVYTHDKTGTRLFRVCQSVLYVVASLGLALTLLCEAAMIAHLASTITLDNFPYFSETLGCTLYSSTAFVKALSLGICHKKVKQITARLRSMYEEEWDEEEWKMIKTTVMPTKRLLSAYCMEVGVTALAFGITQMVMGVISNEGGYIPMPYGLLYPFNPESSMSLYVFLYIAQFYAGFQVGFGSVTFDSIFCNVVTHMAMHFDILCRRLELIGTRSDGDDDDRIKHIVRSHCSLLELCYDANNIFGFAILFNITMNSVVNCNLMLSALISPASVMIKFLLLLFSSLLQLFMLSYYGEKLKTSSGNMVQAAYNSNWNNIPKRTKESLLIILAKGLRCQSLSAFGFTDISMFTFVAVLKVSMSYFTLMKTMYYKTVEAHLLKN